MSEGSKKALKTGILKTLVALKKAIEILEEAQTSRQALLEYNLDVPLISTAVQKFNRDFREQMTFLGAEALTMIQSS